MANHIVIKIPTNPRFKYIFYLRIDVYSIRWYVVNIELSPIRFLYPNEHIVWLCEAHEWLRPYFPFWDWF